MAKVKFQNTDIDGVKAFTDREDPQEAFERKFRVLSENWKEEYYVLCFYGIGGIGKTSFLDKLCRVIRGVEGNGTRLLDKIDCNYIRYDFDAKSAGTDKLTILLSLRRQLGETDKNFKFFRFDSAVLLYAKKSGISMEKDETARSLLESNPWLDAVLSTVGTVPVVGWVAGAIQAIDKSAKTAKEAIGRHMEGSRYKYHLNEIDTLEPPRILENLHRYFIEDMKYNMLRVATKPLVVFLDTYEKYIDTVNNERRMLTEDYWLRKGRTSVIQSVPGVLWVIAGREKLYWEEDDKNSWEGVDIDNPHAKMSEEEKEELAKTDLEQRLLGDLSLGDATTFLQKAGVQEADLCEQLHKLTNGTPLFLDMCVDTYHELYNKGIRPEIGLFGEDIKQLTHRYLFHLNEANREMMYFLACLGIWNDESVRRIAGEATTLRWYTFARYEEFVDHSFIIKNPDGSYYMHETVRSVALKNADKEILEEIGRIKLSVVKESVEKDETLDSNVAFTEYMKTMTESNHSYEEFYRNLQTAKRKFKSLEESGSYDVLYTSAREMFFVATNNYPGTVAEYIARSEYGNALCLKGFVKEALEVVSEILSDEKNFDVEEDWIAVKENLSNIYDANGMYQESFEIEKQLLEIRKRVLGEEHPDTLKSMNGLAISYFRIGERQKAQEMFEQTLELRKRVLGEEHPDTLKSMGGLAVAYYDNGEKEKSLELEKKTLEIRVRVLGEEHPDTLVSMHNLAISYDNMGEQKKAFELENKTFELRVRVLGEEHPDTLTTMNSLAISYEKRGNASKALELREKVLELRKQVLGEAHPDTLSAMHSLGAFYHKIGKRQKALELFEHRWELLEDVYGEEHPETKSAKELVDGYRKLQEKANSIFFDEKFFEKIKVQSDAHMFNEKYFERPKFKTPPLSLEDKEVAELRAQLAETDDPALRCKLAALHLEGRVIELSAVKALELYREAAEQGNCAALFCQAILYLQGRGTKQDVHAAFDLFKKAAEQGHANAQFMMSLFYGTGRVVVRDEQMAARWYERALQTGELKKAYDVNKLFLDCEDAKSNLGLLVAWHEHTSYQEFPISRCNFGYMYETGRGVEANAEKAKEWYEKAARQGDEVAAKLSEGLKKSGYFGKRFRKGRKK